jgi:UDP-N-acetylmuramoyl-L-alanyl-D-glutamate--2,6-diaminopimelate ligase
VMKLSRLIDGMTIDRISGNADLEIRGITKDSRMVEEGYMFFCTRKSASFITEAVKRGARAVVSEAEPGMPVDCLIITSDVDELLGKVSSRFYDMPSRDLFIAGITGTNGKTTTTYLMESIAAAAGRKAGVIGTISYRYGGRTIPAPNTTPGAVEMHSLLRDMRDAGTDMVAMEVSSHALDQKRVEGIEFDMGIFTNLTHDHLDYHETFEKYAEAKKLLFSHYLKKSSKGMRWAILNKDDPAVLGFVPEMPVETLYYSTISEADAYFLSGRESIDGLSLDISVMGERMLLTSPLVGRFNASNILAACLFGYGAGLPADAVKEGVESLPGVPGRLERVVNGKGISVFVDYAHTPDALEKVLELLGRLKKGRLIVIFGCGGDRDNTKRPVMGKIASHLADYSIVTSDNPRSEKPGMIINDITAGFNGGPFTVIEDRKEAIYQGIEMARENDVVLIAGKGHEDYQIIGDQRLHFSDREVAEEFLDVARG